jgi:geranylgeranyl diphosphate synthase type I
MRQIVSAAFQRDEDGFGVMVRYALGWVDQHDQPYQQPTGKRLRPALLLLCCAAAGGAWQKALPAAAAVEFLHNFSLIHDDIQDDSETRHGRPTVWQIWGRANAINAGDTLYTIAYIALEKLSATLPPELALALWRIFNATNIELTRGQHLDMRFERQATVSTTDYVSMISGKSAALLATCAQMGALIGAQKLELAQHYADFGLNIGIAFQIHDDILGIWGDPQVTGKSAATDILSRKKSLPVLYGLEHSPALAAVYQRPQFSVSDVAEAVQLLDSVHAQEYARQQEQHYNDLAMQALDRAQPHGSAADSLREFVAFLFKRSY